MTCEIAVANRLGIALAADSAVTFSSIDGQQTYASGANKIFQLAATQPIAAMIYNNAGLESIPWELLLKEYRRHLCNGGLRDAHAYKNELISFLNENIGLLPLDLRLHGAMPTYYQNIGELLVCAQQLEPVLQDQKMDRYALRDAWTCAFHELSREIQATAPHECLDYSEQEGEVDRATPIIVPQLHDYLSENFSHLASLIDTVELIRLGIDAAFRNWRDVSMGEDYTGVVIAGYGTDEFLPSYCSVRVYGFVGSKLLWKDEGCNAVTHSDRSSFIQPFAQRAMVETFTQGASPEVWKTVKSSYVAHATAACQTAFERAGYAAQNEIVQNVIEDSIDDFMKGWAFATFDAHLRPLQSVVAGLSIPELAELAETLVMLESLKEKVTSRTQSVGGPIDVAVITRAEGLVWIKRKLYFEPHLNQRYALRLQSQYGEKA